MSLNSGVGKQSRLFGGWEPRFFCEISGQDKPAARKFPKGTGDLRCKIKSTGEKKGGRGDRDFRCKEREGKGVVAESGKKILHLIVGNGGGSTLLSQSSVKEKRNNHKRRMRERQR